MPATDAASIWASGRIQWQIPPIAKVALTGVVPPWATGKDVIVALCGLFNNDDLLDHAMESKGTEETMRSLPVDGRLAIANMAAEWSALKGLILIDSALQCWLLVEATALAMLMDSGDVTLAQAARFAHSRIDELLHDPLTAEPGAVYTKSPYPTCRGSRHS